MTKSELIKEISEVSEMTQVDSKKFYDTLEEVLETALSEGDDEIKLGFATIKVVHQDARVARNPKTQEPVDVPAKNVGKISLSAPAKRAVAQ